MSNLPIYVFSGPSGAGKSTVLQMLMEKFPNNFGFSVSHTTRKPRPGEKDGIDYHFTDRDTFLSEISEGKFLEYAEFAGNIYGTSRSAVQSVLDAGRICILDVELEGVKSIHALQPPLNAQYILIRPSSIDELEKRLRGRGTETDETLSKRLARAREDIQFSETKEGQKLFTKIIINDDLNTAFKELEDFLLPTIKCTKCVLVVSWYPNGMSDENGKPVDDLIFSLLNIASQYDIKICLHFEPYKNRDTHTIVEDLKYIYEKGYTSHPAYYRLSVYQSNESKLLPVVYVYDSYRIEPSKWKKILHPNEKETIRNKAYNAFLIGLLLESDDCSKLSESAFNGGYTYFVGNGISKASSPNAWEYLSKECLKYNLTFYPSIGPGYDDVSVRPWNGAATQAREFGHTFTNAFNKAMNAKPTGIGIVSFNEWHEGTQIEPSIPFKWTGYLAPSRVYKDYLPYSPEFYLRLTRLIVNRFEGIDTLPERFTQESEVELSQLYKLLKRD
ncbi:Glycoprotein endo-alpha-1, 2-mannosidase-like protein [Schistosoma japonicum]|uniref:guanylate kinase n=2 Tax=Schistosoma japonicum TaxID=6182 RepID=A0A4Z2DW41_SCHJA|nr:Glycoprotein endo-alpha-1, 2-mannosidase-like protein [Schistosoma japonicum]